MAEAYWDLEWALQQQGFDYCYDKRLYDRLVHDGAEDVHGHLNADIGVPGAGWSASSRTTTSRARRRRSRARRRAPPPWSTLTQTGARLVHEGQLEGRTVQLPVFLARRPDEPPDVELDEFYDRLLAALRDGVFRDGEWQLGERRGWDGNDTWQNLVAWGWRGGESRRLVVVNLGDAPASGHVSLPWDDLRGRHVAARRRRRAARATSGAATTSATGSTSRSIPGPGTSST